MSIAAISSPTSPYNSSFSEVVYTPQTPFTPYTEIPFEGNLDSIESIINAIIHLLKNHARSQKDVLHILEQAARHNWDMSIKRQLDDMRASSDRLLKVSGIALSVVGAIPQIAPSTVQSAVKALADKNLIPNFLARCDNNENKIAKVVGGIVSIAQNMHQQADTLNASRVKANETQNRSLGDLFRDSYQKHSSAQEQEKRAVEDLIRSLEEIMRSKQQALQGMIR